MRTSKNTPRKAPSSTRTSPDPSANISGWIGAQIGGTLWMVILGVLRFEQAPDLAITLFLLAGITNLVGTLLWRQRERRPWISSLRLLTITMGLATALALVYADYSGTIPLIDARFQDAPRAIYLVLLIFPFMLGIVSRRPQWASSKN